MDDQSTFFSSLQKAAGEYVRLQWISILIGFCLTLLVVDIGKQTVICRKIWVSYKTFEIFWCIADKTIDEAFRMFGNSSWYIFVYDF